MLAPAPKSVPRVWVWQEAVFAIRWDAERTQEYESPMVTLAAPATMKATTDVSLGRAIRALRVSRGLSLSHLALAAALDKGYLSRVERGLKVPSVAIVLRISTALEVSAAQLFGAAENHQLIFVTRAGDRDALTADDGNYHMEVLTRGTDSSGLEVFLMYPPAEFANEPEATHRGEEVLFVIQGKVEVRFADQELVLNKGDSVQFPGVLRHKVRRLADKSCVLISVYGP